MSGLALALAGLAVAGVAVAHYASTVRAVRVARRPIAHQVALVAAAALGLAALAAGPGWIGGAISIALVLGAALFLFLTNASALPQGRITLALGGPALDFTASDASGRPFALSSLRGQRILLKFFRGHW